MEPRPYQMESVAATYEYLEREPGNPCIVLPTGTGKSIVIAMLVADTVGRWGGRVCVLAHVKELLEQNAAEIRLLCPTLDIGIYSAGLKKRDTGHNVIVAGIQSVYRRADDLGSFDLIIVDEAHLIPPDGDGMYQSFLRDAKVINPRVRLVGLTATPYRLQGGLICGPSKLLHKIVYEYSIKSAIADGYLAPLKSRGGKARADLSGVAIRGGEFVESQMQAAFDQSELIRDACAEIVALTGDRQSILLFCAGIEHAKHVAATIREMTGQEVGEVYGDTPQRERDITIRRFKGLDAGADDLLTPRGPLRWLVNVAVLTTGFNHPALDCIAMLRATESPGLLVQIAGRGTRRAPHKSDCLFLDYGDNILRHGPIDAIVVREKGEAKGLAPSRECPECAALVGIAIAICPECGYAWPPPERDGTPRHGAMASDMGILSGEVTDSEHEVFVVDYREHRKKGSQPGDPRTMRVDYRLKSGITISEWVCPEHEGFARGKFVKWWTERCRLPPPGNVDHCLSLAEGGLLATPAKITVRIISGERFPRVLSAELPEKPEISEQWHEHLKGDLGYFVRREVVPAAPPEPLAIADTDEVPF